MDRATSLKMSGWTWPTLCWIPSSGLRRLCTLDFRKADVRNVQREGVDLTPRPETLKA